jgi:multiple sugar transport system substrate-binding protein
VVLTAMLVAAVVAVGCGHGAKADRDDAAATTPKADVAAALSQPTKITVWAWTPGTDEAAEMFEKAHPQIDVEVRNVGQGPPHYSKLRNALRSGKGLPDVVQMELQYIPSYTITHSLVDLAPYLPDDFLAQYPAWIRRQVSSGGAIHGVPWDTGPLGFIYREDLLAKAGITTPIKTWQAFADAAVAYHAANPDSYLTNMPGSENGMWLGLFWQAGARPFTSDPNDLRIDLTDPRIRQVTEFWDRLYANGSISHEADFTDAWYQGFAHGRYAGWVTAAWGPVLLQDVTKRSRGRWRAQALPQWQDGEHVSANWGGSTLGVVKGSRHPAVAAEFARWILTEREPVEMFAYKRFLFPALTRMLDSEAWLSRRYPFYGAQEANRVFAGEAEAVDQSWQWPPILEHIATVGDDLRGNSVEAGKGATAALARWQDAALRYAREQGLEVHGG